MERGIAQKLEADKQSLERAVRELKSKVTELETSSQTRARAQIAALEARLQNLDEQLNQEVQERNNATRMCKRLDKRLQEAALSLEEERRQTEQFKEQVGIFPARYEPHQKDFRPRRLT